MSDNTILIVDDDASIRELLVDFLSEQGYSPLAIANGQAALDLLQTTPILPSVMLLDMMMPELSGPDLLAVLALNPRLASLPVIVFSGSPTLHQRLQGRNIAAVLAKPVDLDTLLYIIRPYCQ